MRPADWFFAALLLLVAATLRFTGIDFGQPNPAYNRSLHPRLHPFTPLHPDEFYYVSIPCAMLAKGRRSPDFYENPSFLIYLNYATFGLTGACRDVDTSVREGLSGRSYAPFPLYVIGRVYSALGGLLAVAASYALARHLAGRYAAGTAGLLAAFSMPLVQHAHYSTTSSLAAGFVMLCLLCLVISLKSSIRYFRYLELNHRNTGSAEVSQKKFSLSFYFVAAGIGAGLAAGNRYNAAAVSIAVLVAGLLLLRHPARRTSMIVVAGYLAFPLTFLLTTPGALLDFQQFREQFSSIYARFASSEGLTLRGLFYEYRYILIFGTGIPAAVLILPGFRYLVSRIPPRTLLQTARGSKMLFSEFGAGSLSRLAAAVLFCYLLPYTIFVLNTSLPEIGDQLTVPIIPVWIVLAGAGMAWLISRLPLRRMTGPLIIAAALFQPAVPALQTVVRFTQPDTRELMQAWINATLPQGAPIHLAGSYNVPLDTGDYVLSEDLSCRTSLAKIMNSGVNYIVYSDAAMFFMARDDVRDDLMGPECAAFQQLPRLAWIDRPAMCGDTLMPNNAAYWHNPGLIVYCVQAEECAAGE